MDGRLKEILKPEVVNTVNGLELIARIIVEGFMSGGNKSNTIGVGQEFSQYRHYEPGDDLRQLDWKMYARSERYFIKQAEVETNITVKFFLDASRSMAHIDETVSKLQYAKVVAAALAYLARKQGDTFGLYGINNVSQQVIEPRHEQQQFMRFLHQLIQLEPQGHWLKTGTEHLFNHHGKELIIFISDLYDDNNDIMNFITRLKTTRNEVVIFHLMTEDEINLDLTGSFAFRDLETNTVVKVDPQAQRKRYQENVAQWMHGLRMQFLERSIHYYLVNTQHPIEEMLRNFLKIRKQLQG